MNYKEFIAQKRVFWVQHKLKKGEWQIMSKVLELVFKDAKGKTKSFNINDPRDTVTKAEAETAMKNIITANVFNTTNGDLTDTSEVRVRTTVVEPLA